MDACRPKWDRVACHRIGGKIPPKYERILNGRLNTPKIYKRDWKLGSHDLSVVLLIGVLLSEKNYGNYSHDPGVWSGAQNVAA